MFVMKGGKLIYFFCPILVSGKTTIVKHLFKNQPELNLAFFNFSGPTFQKLDVGKEKNGEHYYFMSIVRI